MLQIGPSVCEFAREQTGVLVLHMCQILRALDMGQPWEASSCSLSSHTQRLRNAMTCQQVAYLISACVLLFAGVLAQAIGPNWLRPVELNHGLGHIQKDIPAPALVRCKGLCETGLCLGLQCDVRVELCSPFGCRLVLLCVSLLANKPVYLSCTCARFCELLIWGSLGKPAPALSAATHNGYVMQ